jgi:hypothetical protein
LSILSILLVFAMKSPTIRRGGTAMNKRRGKSYRGELAHPIQEPSPSLLKLLYPDVPETERERCYVEDERAWKMKALLAHFGIEHRLGARPWYELALCLAQELGVPGLKIGARARGRSRNYGEAEFRETEAIIDAFNLRGRRKFLHSALAKLQELSPHRYGKMSIGVFRSSYYVERNRLQSKK